MSLEIYLQESFAAADAFSGAAFSEKPYVVLDATIQEDYHFSAQATQHPIEEGSDISDNYRVNPFRYTVTGFVTNHPLKKPETQAEGVEEQQKEFSWEVRSVDFLGVQIGGRGLLGVVGTGVLGATSLNQQKGSAKGFNVQFNRVGGVFTAIRQIIDNKQIIAIVAGLDFYQNMVIEDYGVFRDALTGEALQFTAEIKQLRVTTSNTASVPEPTGPRPVPQSKIGRRPNSTPTDANTDKTREKITSLTELG